MNEPAAIELDDVTKLYDGKPAVHHLTLRVPPGSVCGFLGRNGSGKTTTLRLLAGLNRPTHGQVRVHGVDPLAFTTEDRQRVGYVSERQILPMMYKVGSVLAFCRPFYPKWDQALAERLLSRFEIDPGKRIMKLSMGARRAVAFILVLAQGSDLLLLDEPAANLDPVARREFLAEMLDAIRDEGRTVFMSTHILSDIERVADSIALLAGGKLVLHAGLDELKDEVRQVRLTGLPPHREVAVPGALAVKREGSDLLATVRLRDDAPLHAVAAAHSAQLTITPLGLEDIFLALCSQERRPL